MRAVIEDIGVDAIKTGMLGDAATIDAVVGVLEGLKGSVPIVVDPVMIAKGGASLLPDAAVGALKDRLLPLATLVTPKDRKSPRLNSSHSCATRMPSSA